MRYIYNIFLAITILVSTVSCQGSATESKRGDDSAPPSLASKPAANDEQEFRSVLSQLRTVLKKKNLTKASELMNFPFFSSRASLNDKSGPAIDPISIGEYPEYINDIFNTDVVRLLPSYSEEQLSEIDLKTDDPYYSSLAKLTDSGSHLYEVYFQYPESGTNAESFFGFVFGKVKGKYKAVGMYGKWPIK